MRLALQLLASLLLAVTMLGCGSDTTGPGVDPGPRPDPDGVLLAGSDGDLAVNALVELPPSAVADEEIGAGRLLTTRLVAVLNPDATVGEINGVLATAGARIVSMHPDDIFLSLKIPAVADETAARAVAGQVSADRAFAFAMPAWGVDGSFGGDEVTRELPPSGAQTIAHLFSARWPAAWNAKRLALAGGVMTTVVVPDIYVDDEPCPAIACQQFLSGYGATTNSTTGGRYDGNHGYAVSGIIGANHDAISATGTSPIPGALLDIQSLPLGGLTWVEILREVFTHLPAGSAFVVNTSLSYNRPVTTELKLQAALEAIYWRALVSQSAGDFLHTASAGDRGEMPGDDGDARYNSPFVTAHVFADLREVVADAGVSTADSLWLDVTWRHHVDENPAVGEALANVLVVGSSDTLGTESAFSSRGSEVRAVGEQVFSTCQVSDPDQATNPDVCSDDGGYWDGSSFAAPQVAGLAAYLWSLDSDLTPTQIRDGILHAYEHATIPGVVDAYTAVLSLDSSSRTDVRRAILDVGREGAIPGSDGVFDENDLAVFVAAFQAADGALDHSRYDLNGDGRTGGGSTARFDLTRDSPPIWTENIIVNIGGDSETMNERAVTDCDVLLYYAYRQGIYQGNTSDRAEIMSFCRPVPLPDMNVMNLNLALAVTVTYLPSGRVEVEDYRSETVRAEGGFYGDQISFIIDETVNVGGTQRVYSGTAIGTLALDGVTIEALNVAYTVEVVGGSETRSIAYMLEDIPLEEYGSANVVYHVSGEDVCDHVTNVDMRGTNAAETWRVTSYECLADHDIYINLFD